MASSRNTSLTTDTIHTQDLGDGYYLDADNDEYPLAAHISPLDVDDSRRAEGLAAVTLLGLSVYWEWLWCWLRCSRGSGEKVGGLGDLVVGVWAFVGCFRY